MENVHAYIFYSNILILMSTMLLSSIIIAGLITLSSASVLPDSTLTDSLIVEEVTAPVDPNNHGTIQRLTEEDFTQAAEQLGIDVATIKAVISIEAGAGHQGFHAPGKPIINFDLAMFRRAASKRGINLNKYKKSHKIVFNRANTQKYGSYQAAQHERLRSAMTIDSIAAIDGTFWGMFQIGGFNWKKCGAKSRGEFVERMSDSEHEQLELFVNFIKTNGMDKYLKKKDWAGFARCYNGPSYARRGYHTRLAKAYKKYKKQSAR